MSEAEGVHGREKKSEKKEERERLRECTVESPRERDEKGVVEEEEEERERYGKLR